MAIIAHKTRLETNNKLNSLFNQYAGTVRYVYNWGYGEWGRVYQEYVDNGKEGHGPSAYSLRKSFNAQKDDICPWIRQYPYCLTEWAFMNLGNAYNRWFDYLKNPGKYPREIGHPKPKSRYGKASFGMRGYKVDDDYIWLGRRVGWVKISEKDYIPDGIKYKEQGGSVYTVLSRQAGHWFVSVSFEQEFESIELNPIVLGIDFGIKEIATLSNGKVFHNPRPLSEAQRKLKRLQRELARRKKGGANWQKTKEKLAKAHYKVKCVRRHIQHEISSYAVYKVRPEIIVLEDLNVGGMTKNHNLAQAISDVGFYELRRQIEYKAERTGAEVVIADKWYPSSKTCSRCGAIKKDLTLSDRTFICPDCGFEIDRDYNAALNLAALGYT